MDEVAGGPAADPMAGRPSRSSAPGDAAGSAKGDAAGSAPGSTPGGAAGSAKGGAAGSAPGGTPGGAAGSAKGGAAGSAPGGTPGGAAGSAKGGAAGSAPGGAATSEPTRIAVGGERPYYVLVGRGLLAEVPALLRGAAAVAVLAAPPLRDLAGQVAASLGEAGIEPLLIEVPDAEAGKRIEVAARCWERLGEAGFTRTDAVVGIGGGALTDLAGFVAACWLRGVRVVQVPTSLLGMVDAAVGGKTGVNTAAGKNLVGAFHPPAGVVCDMSTLETLPGGDLVAGLAEVVKCGFIADPAILDLIEADPGAAVEPGGAVRELVERSVRVKAAIVSRDLRESGPREFLNYGHTLGHAIERREGYAWRHGDAVSVGLVFAAALGRLAGRLAGDVAARHRSVLETLGLPVTYPAAAWDELRAGMRVDKKSRGARLRFVVLDGLARPSILDDPDDGLLREAYREMAT
jgi:3-dehydroquinate synthase